MSSIKPQRDAGDVEDGEKAGCCLLIAGCDGAEAFEGMETALDSITQGVELSVEPLLTPCVGFGAMTGFMPRARIALRNRAEQYPESAMPA